MAFASTPEKALVRIGAHEAALERERRELLAFIQSAEADAGKLRIRALDLARTKELSNAELAEFTKATMAPFRAKRQQPEPAISRSERKLDLVVRIGELEHHNRRLETEAAEWSDRAMKSEEQRDKLEMKLANLHPRFKETTAELRSKLVRALDDRRALDAEIHELEAAQSESDIMTAELRTLRRDVLAVSEQVAESKREEEDWTRRLRFDTARLTVRSLPTFPSLGRTLSAAH
jgi:hypothetical protein